MPSSCVRPEAAVDRIYAYRVFTALATQVYLIMYVLMFIAAVKLRRSQPDRPRGYRAPALGLLYLLGSVSSVAALVIGFIPPSQFGHSNPLTRAIEILAGILAIGIVPPLLMDRLRKPQLEGSERRIAGGPTARPAAASRTRSAERPAPSPSGPALASTTL